MGALAHPAKIRGKLYRLLYEDSVVRDQGIFVVIEGPTGAGKSTLALRIARFFLGDWDKVLDHVFFTPFEFEEKAEAAQRKGFKYRILVWDDAGPWFRIMKHATWDPLTVSVLGHLETMRTWVNILIATMTTDKHLPGAIEENGYIYKYKITVWKDHFDERLGRWHATGTIKIRRRRQDGKFYWDLRDRDGSELRIGFWHFPEGHPVYAKYYKMRCAYTEIYNNVMESAKRYSKAAVSLSVAHENWKSMREKLLA